MSLGQNSINYRSDSLASLGFSNIYIYSDTAIIIGATRGGGDNSNVKLLVCKKTLSEDNSETIIFPIENSNYYPRGLYLISDNRLHKFAASDKLGQSNPYLDIYSYDFELNETRKLIPLYGRRSIQPHSVIQYEHYSSIYGIFSSQDSVSFFSEGALFKFNSDADTIFTKYYSDPSFDLNFSASKFIDENRILVGGKKTNYNEGWTKTDDEHYTWLGELDTNGNILWQWTDDQNLTWMPSSIINTSDGGIIYACQKGFFNDFNGISQGNFITKLNASKEQEWELQIDSMMIHDFGVINNLSDIIVQNDGTFIIAGSNAGEINQNQLGTSAIVLKFDLSGNIIWRRNIVPPLQGPTTQDLMIYQTIQTEDGGFAMVGESHDSEGVGANQQGWFLKTNCLGYMAPPSAACYAGNSDNYGIVFQNNSLNGGEFEWDFGDGDTAVSSEGDTVGHFYAGTGPYQVKLIAKGCNGEADTIYFEVNPTPLSIEETTEFGDGTFDVYPNPAQNRAFLSINLPSSHNLDSYRPGSMANARFTITDISGKTHQTFAVSQNQYTQEVDISNLPQGIYFVNLSNQNGIIKTRKLVVR